MKNMLEGVNTGFHRIDERIVPVKKNSAYQGLIIPQFLCAMEGGFDSFFYYLLQAAFFKDLEGLFRGAAFRSYIAAELRRGFVRAIHQVRSAEYSLFNQCLRVLADKADFHGGFYQSFRKEVKVSRTAAADGVTISSASSLSK